MHKIRVTFELTVRDSDELVSVVREIQDNFRETVSESKSRKDDTLRALFATENICDRCTCPLPGKKYEYGRQIALNCPNCGEISFGTYTEFPQ